MHPITLLTIWLFFFNTMAYTASSPLETYQIETLRCFTEKIITYIGSYENILAQGAYSIDNNIKTVGVHNHATQQHIEKLSYCRAQHLSMLAQTLHHAVRINETITHLHHEKPEISQQCQYIYNECKSLIEDVDKLTNNNRVLMKILGDICQTQPSLIPSRQDVISFHCKIKSFLLQIDVELTDLKEFLPPLS